MYSFNFEYLENVFSSDNIRKNLYDYYGLSEMGILEITSYNESFEKKHVFSRSDSVFLSAIRVVKRYDSLFAVPYIVEAIIGDFTVDVNIGATQLSKYRIEILYSSDFQIASIDYFH